jgi:hypothetical protein
MRSWNGAEGYHCRLHPAVDPQGPLRVDLWDGTVFRQYSFRRDFLSGLSSRSSENFFCADHCQNLTRIAFPFEAGLRKLLADDYRGEKTPI